MIYGQGGSKILTRNVEVPDADRLRFCINDDEVLKLAEYAIAIEDYYSEKFGEPRPMDIEWAKDGITGELFVVQARPETVQSQRSKDVLETYVLEKRSEVLVIGRSVGDKIASGKAHVIPDISDLPSFKPGNPGCGYHNSGLGACNENRGCYCYKQRRKNLPRSYCQSRTRNSCCCGSRQCNRSA